MTEFIKVWWHCLLKMHQGHRMCIWTYAKYGKRWSCDCGFNELKD